MADHHELVTRHEHRVEQIRLQADLRRQDRIGSEEYRAEIERLRGENERGLALLHHDLERENRALDLKFQELRNSQQVRLEAIQTAIRQHDEFFRHYWEIDKEVVRLETRLIELVVEAHLTASQSVLEHQHLMASTMSQHDHARTMAEEERNTLTLKDNLDKGNFEFKERLKIQLAREFSTASTEQINAAVEKLAREGKI